MDKTEILPNAVYNTTEASKLLGLDDQTVLKRAKSGEIKVKFVGNKNLYLGSDLISYIKNLK